MSNQDQLTLVAQIAANYLRRSQVGVDQISVVIRNITTAMMDASRQLTGEHAEPVTVANDAAAAQAAEAPAAPPTPAVPVEKSVERNHLVCLEDGQHVKTLKRHLQSAHGMTPQEYRTKWGLPRDYPMSAPAYSESRSNFAKARGLGRKPNEPTATAAEETAEAPPAEAPRKAAAASRSRPARAAASKKGASRRQKKA